MGLRIAKLYLLIIIGNGKIGIGKRKLDHRHQAS